MSDVQIPGMRAPSSSGAYARADLQNAFDEIAKSTGTGALQLSQVGQVFAEQLSTADQLFGLLDQNTSGNLEYKSGGEQHEARNAASLFAGQDAASNAGTGEAGAMAGWVDFDKPVAANDQTKIDRTNKALVEAAGADGVLTAQELAEAEKNGLLTKTAQGDKVLGALKDKDGNINLAHLMSKYDAGQGLTLGANGSALGDLAGKSAATSAGNLYELIANSYTAGANSGVAKTEASAPLTPPTSPAAASVQAPTLSGTTTQSRPVAKGEGASHVLLDAYPDVFQQGGKKDFSQLPAVLAHLKSMPENAGKFDPNSKDGFGLKPGATLTLPSSADMATVLANKDKFEAVKTGEAEVGQKLAQAWPQSQIAQTYSAGGTQGAGAPIGQQNTSGTAGTTPSQANATNGSLPAQQFYNGMGNTQFAANWTVIEKLPADQRPTREQFETFKVGADGKIPTFGLVAAALPFSDDPASEAYKYSYDRAFNDVYKLDLSQDAKRAAEVAASLQFVAKQAQTAEASNKAAEETMRNTDQLREDRDKEDERRSEEGGGS